MTDDRHEDGEEPMSQFVAAAAADAADARDRLREQFSATEAFVSTHQDSSEVNIRLTFEGFEGVGIAAGRLREVLDHLESSPHSGNVRGAVESDGLPARDDDRPASWAEAEFFGDASNEQDDPWDTTIIAGDGDAGVRVHEEDGESLSGVEVPEGTVEIYSPHIEFSQVGGSGAASLDDLAEGDE